MNKQALDQIWDQFRQKYGVYLRVLEAIPTNRYSTHPVPGMRTPAELAVHISSTCVRDIAEGVAKGRITVDEGGEDKIAAGLGQAGADRVRAGVLRPGERRGGPRRRRRAGGEVPTPWGSSWHGAVAFHIMNDEFVHHRGQLTAFIRLCGGEPPFLWGYADNAPEYRPRTVAEPAGA